MKNIKYLLAVLGGMLIVSCSKKELQIGDADPANNKFKTTSFTNAFPSAIPNDPFTPYLTSTPTILQTISTQNSGSGATAITTKRFTFKSKGGVNTVYAIMTYPQAAGTYPAILFNHGGGGNAETMWRDPMQTFANLGYVTMAIDIPGIAGTDQCPNSSGPWKSAAAGEGPRLNVTGGPQNSTLFDGGVAEIEAFNFLAAQANVNNTKMGVSGVSWGGYMTTMLSGILGSRVKAAYAIYGCGFYDLGTYWSSLLEAMTPADRTTWETYLDAGRRCPYMTAPYFIEEPSDDTYFWPEGVAGTLNAIPGTKNHVVMPDSNHHEFPPGRSMKQMYMDYYLKGTGNAFGSVTIASTVVQTDGSLQVNMTTSLAPSTSVSAVQLFYSVPTANWQTRSWLPITATLVSGTTYRATIPASQVNQNVNYFGQFTDSRTVVTSTLIYQTGYMDHFDALTGWGSSNTLTLNTTDKKEGTGSIQSVGSSTDEFKRLFTTPYNSGATVVSGSIQFWYYISDVTKMGTSNQIEIGSGGAPDVQEYSWNLGTLVNGWNLISKPFSSAATTGGTPNLNAINWFRVYDVKTGSITTKIDGLQVLK